MTTGIEGIAVSRPLILKIHMNDFETAKHFFVAGLHCMEKADFLAAEQHFGQALALIPDRISTLNNLSAIKNRLEKFAEAEKLARKAISLEITHREAWLNFVNALSNLGQIENPEEALRLCETALKTDANPYEAWYAQSLILKRLNQPEAAKAAYKSAIASRAISTPIFSPGSHRGNQRAKVLVVSPNPALSLELKSFEDLHLDVNFPGQIARILSKEYHFSFVFQSVVVNRHIRQQIPKPDFIINNNANGESLLTTDDLPEYIEALESFGVPIVNHPDQVIQTTRDASVRCLVDIPSIVVPKTERFCTTRKSRETVIREIENRYDYPLITRTLAAQEGKGMTKVESRESLDAVLTSTSAENFFVTAFVDSRNGNPLYRKIRAAFVKDQLLIVRVDYDTNWNVHGRKSDERVQFYLKNPALLDQEQQICIDPGKNLGISVMQSLRAMRDRIPLDVFGVDFDVDAAGRLVFYEANASMNLFSTARKEVRHPQSADEALKLALCRYFDSLKIHP
jgi:tetratricopeptide (TPR) repeat protein